MVHDISAVSRRALLCGLAGLASASRGAPGWAAALPNSEILSAPTSASILLVRLLASGALNPVLPGARIRTWHDPDELRAAIVSGRTKLFSSPTHVPANLANRGIPVKLAAVIGMGHLAIVSSDPAIRRMGDLAGKSLVGFFRNDMPDLVFRATARMEGLDPDRDVKLTYVGSPMEAAQLVAAGRAQSAILSEPAATGAMMMAAQHDRTLFRAINLQDVWIRHKGGAGIPMVGIAVDESLLEAAPGLLPLLRIGLPQAKDWVFAHPGEAAALAEATLHHKAEVFRAALPRSGIVVMSGLAARAGLEAFYQTILELSPGALDGRLPSADFYLAL